MCQACERGQLRRHGAVCCSEGWVHIGSESCKRSSPGTESPALNFEVRVAYSSSIAHPALPTDLNEWLHHYKQERMRQGKIRWSCTPFETMIDGK